MKFLLVTSLVALALVGCNRGQTYPSTPIGAYTYNTPYTYPTPSPYPGAGYTYYPNPTPYPINPGGYTNYNSYNGYSYGTGSMTCMIGHLNVTYFVGSWVFEAITTSTGEPVIVTAWDAGEPWDVPPTFPKYMPLSVRYATSGTKLMQVWARGQQSGTPCNNGAPLTDYVYVY